MGPRASDTRPAGVNNTVITQNVLKHMIHVVSIFINPVQCAINMIVCFSRSQLIYSFSISFVLEEPG